MSYHIVDIWSPSDNIAGLNRPSWQERSNCAGKTNLFFATAIGRKAAASLEAAERAAKALCAECQVRDECLRFALDADERFGVWGGLNVAERDLVRDGFVAKANVRRRTPRRVQP